ncbi:competence type IV pilus minor pilin ComGF [Macrococcus lamae]|uniref:competence type IV pilus minor pilin ComGF n=1 Tax=Macrococcus lamae TaxID=198484 RepID=UPI001408071C|nr:competence type IV pilus minor pilin ComGF [Macrococcus lamae]
MKEKDIYAGQPMILSVFKKDEGFTLLEMLLNFSIAIIIMSLFPLIIQNIMMFKSVSSDNYDINFELCLRDILSEIKNKEVTAVNGELLAKDLTTGKIYSYNYHLGRIIRKVDRAGYVILLEQVKQAEFYEQNQSVFLRIKWQDARRIRNETLQIK